MINFCIPTLNQYGPLHNLIEACEKSTLVPDHYMIIDNGQGLKPKFSASVRAKMTIYTPQYNLGVASSFNYFLQNNDDYIIVSNDDLIPDSESIEALVNAAENSDQLFFCTGDASMNAWSFFLEKKASIEIIGLYDEAIWPGYFEDNDKSRRYRLAGYQIVHVPGARIKSHIGSATLKAYSPERTRKHHEEFNRNQDYYVSKWGGLPEQEKYDTPFNI